MRTDERHHLLLSANPDVKAEVAAVLRQRPEFVLSAASTLDEAVFALEEKDIDALFLDATLSHRWPAAYCRSFRQRGIAVPIIVIMTEFDPAIYWSLREAGASSCIIRPIRLGILLARLAVSAQRLRDGCIDMLIIGRFRFFTNERLLREPGTTNEIELDEQEGRILQMLYAARGRAVDRATLERTIWGPETQDAEQQLRDRIRSLREKIERDPSAPRLLLSEDEAYCLEPLGRLCTAAEAIPDAVEEQGFEASKSPSS